MDSIHSLDSQPTPNPTTIESSKIGEALDSLSFGRKLINLKYQTPKISQVQALNSSYSV